MTERVSDGEHYNKALKSDLERREGKNGVWMCVVVGVDGEEDQFEVEIHVCFSIGSLLSQR